MHFYFEDDNHSETVLLLHGFMSDLESMKSIGENLSDEYNLLYVDLPGFGGSGSVRHDYDMEDVSHGISEILDSLHLDKVHVIGYSMGGRTALSFGVLYPEKVHSLILESASPGLADKEEKAQRLEIDRKRARKITEDYQKFLDDWEGMGLFKSQQHLSEEVFKAQRSMRERQQPKEVADSLLKYGTGVQPSYWSRLENLKMPVLLITGSDDRKFVAVNKKMAESIEKVRLETVGGAGHNIHLESAEKFDTIITEFLK
ncbi:2-succinyl-6-hydroxy-2,4-cyclohexadiene-1-carboxylate synthase [Lacicoccus qingdaonensis]|uniref:Putative 2-succinyl-6-hydroxy-2,4-cyclohexadiene-1-carboxylate synthase n=2 Tax=Lacicoccus qingdaonensis TaxID=576118 RepID=A0A1G9FWZ2_9BACL|nr:2-succinyl-6-hydroxy-2,4-cyclohexadiene-1-carboxylate synthase [Salinicoccus qingdaonensis]